MLHEISKGREIMEGFYRKVDGGARDTEVLGGLGEFFGHARVIAQKKTIWAGVIQRSRLFSFLLSVACLSAASWLS